MTLDGDDPVGERQHRPVDRGPVGARRCGDRSRGEPLAAHRAAAIDDERERSRRLGPVPNPEIARIDELTGGPCVDEAVEARVEVEVAVDSVGRGRRHCAHATGLNRARLGHVEHKPTGKAGR